MQQATVSLELQPSNLHASCEKRTAAVAASARTVQVLTQQGNVEHLLGCHCLSEAPCPTCHVGCQAPLGELPPRELCAKSLRFGLSEAM